MRLLPSAKSRNIRAPFSSGTGQRSLATMMSENFQQLDFLPMGSALTRSAADSPAKTSLLQARVRDLMESAAGYGQKSPVLLARLDPDFSSWRTSQHSLEGGLTEFSETWPRSGMMQSGIAYQLPTLVSDTFGTEFGLWPTPNATAFKGGRTSPRRGVKNPERNNWQDWCSLVLGQRYPVPETAEQVMGLPTGHTAIEP